MTKPVPAAAGGAVAGENEASQGREKEREGGGKKLIPKNRSALPIRGHCVCLRSATAETSLPTTLVEHFPQISVAPLCPKCGQWVESDGPKVHFSTLEIHAEHSFRHTTTTTTNRG